MAEELQQLLEKIQRDGVDKANAEAAAIVAKAKAEAEAIVKKAQEDAAAAEAKGKADAEAYAARARETISQAARDTVLKVREDVTKLLTKLLAQDVSAALATEAVPLAAAAVKELVTGSGAEVAASAKLVDALFTDAAISEALAQRLRSDLAALLK